LALERVQERRAFGRNIGEFGLIKDKIAGMLAQTYALESMTYLTTGLVDARIPDYSLESAICKVFGSESLCWIANETMQIAAGIGFLQKYPYERMWRDARFNLIFEGTNEILRCFIALAGMAGPGQKVSSAAKAMREPIKGIGLLKNFALRKARSTLFPERATRVHPTLNRAAVTLEECTGQLTRQVENVLRKHGSENCRETTRPTSSGRYRHRPICPRRLFVSHEFCHREPRRRRGVPGDQLEPHVCQIGCPKDAVQPRAIRRQRRRAAKGLRRARVC